MSEIRNLEPKALWNHFADLCAIPRPSKHEEVAASYALQTAREHGLEAEQDKAGNVLIRKPAFPGYENLQTVILQAHLDMVPQKNASVKHDFLKDPILPVIEGEWVGARGTTLGADNGIGVAAALAVLTSPGLLHGPLEVLLTVDEETGMTGARQLSPDWLQGRILFNLDTEEEGEFCIGCAGGLDVTAGLSYSYDPTQGKFSTYQINLSGLKGGHSGVDIHLGRANSNQLMVRLVWKITRDFQASLVEMGGGNMRNAIPREAYAIVNIPLSEEEAFLEYISSFGQTISFEYRGVETDIQWVAERIPLREKAIDKVTETLFINALYALPNGPVRMIPETHVVETSTNLSIVSVKEGMAQAACLLRSASETAKISLGERMQAAFELIGAEVVLHGDYPGWDPDFSSPVLGMMKKVYAGLYGKNPLITVIHAGLECGLIGSHYPGMQMVSFGPTILHPHSPDEKVHIGDTLKFWDYLVHILPQIPASPQ